MSAQPREGRSVGPHISRNNLLFPCPPRIFLPKQALPHLARGPVATDYVVCHIPLRPLGGLDNRPRLIPILPNIHNSMFPADGATILGQEPIKHDLVQLLHGEARRALILTVNILHDAPVEARNGAVVLKTSPKESIGPHAPLVDLG